jgi:hypothetical protein
MTINIYKAFTLIILTGLIFTNKEVIGQGVVPGVKAPVENSKRLPAKLTIEPVMKEFFDAPINTKRIEANVKEFTPSNSTPKTDCNIIIESHPETHMITQISTSVNKQSDEDTKKIYLLKEPVTLQNLKTYTGSPDNWKLLEEKIFSYPGMGGSRSLLTRKVWVIKGSDTTALNSPKEETYIYNTNMHLVQYTVGSETHSFQFDDHLNISTEKINYDDSKWQLLEYTYQYNGDNWSDWIKKEIFVTTPDQPRYLKTSITRKVTLQ